MFTANVLYEIDLMSVLMQTQGDPYGPHLQVWVESGVRCSVCHRGNCKPWSIFWITSEELHTTDYRVRVITCLFILTFVRLLYQPTLYDHRYFNGGPPAETDFGGDVSWMKPFTLSLFITAIISDIPYNDLFSLSVWWHSVWTGGFQHSGLCSRILRPVPRSNQLSFRVCLLDWQHPVRASSHLHFTIGIQR